jgi:hypothetical protein
MEMESESCVVVMVNAAIYLMSRTAPIARVSCFQMLRESNPTQFLLEAGLFESRIRIRYACVHLGRFTKENPYNYNKKEYTTE